MSCRGRSRTSTEQLAIAQRLVVNPGRGFTRFWRITSALCYVYPVISTPETRGHVCQKFHHPTVYVYKNYNSAMLKKIVVMLEIFQ